MACQRSMLSRMVCPTLGSRRHSKLRGALHLAPTAMKTVRSPTFNVALNCETQRWLPCTTPDYCLYKFCSVISVLSGRVGPSVALLVEAVIARIPCCACLLARHPSAEIVGKACVRSFLVSVWCGRAGLSVVLMVEAVVARNRRYDCLLVRRPNAENVERRVCGA